MVPGHGRRRGVETVDGADLGVMMVVRRRRNHRAQGVHPREAFAAQRRGHFGRPVVVRAVRAVEGVRVCERLADEAVQAGAETGLKVDRVRRGVRVPRLLPPLRPPIFEPYLKQQAYRCSNAVLLFDYSFILIIVNTLGYRNRYLGSEKNRDNESAENISEYNN